MPANAKDMGSIPVLGRPPAGGHGNPLQYSCLENPMDEDLVGYRPGGCKKPTKYVLITKGRSVPCSKEAW